jgi:hypothetical protein
MATLVDRKTRAYRQAKQLLAFITANYPELPRKELSKIVDRLSPARHSPDFRSVKWFGQSFVFTPAQSVIVRELWQAWEHGTPKVGAAALLEASAQISDKISELFKRSEAWNVMVRTDGNGYYWLQTL